MSFECPSVHLPKADSSTIIPLDDQNFLPYLPPLLGTVLLRWFAGATVLHQMFECEPEIIPKSCFFRECITTFSGRHIEVTNQKKWLPPRKGRNTFAEEARFWCDFGFTFKTLEG